VGNLFAGQGGLIGSQRFRTARKIRATPDGDNPQQLIHCPIFWVPIEEVQDYFLIPWPKPSQADIEGPARVAKSPDDGLGTEAVRREIERVIT
jgi:hypothetical protein